MVAEELRPTALKAVRIAMTIAWVTVGSRMSVQPTQSGGPEPGRRRYCSRVVGELWRFGNRDSNSVPPPHEHDTLCSWIRSPEAQHPLLAMGRIPVMTL
jgi:hypothetical protein